MWHTIYIYHSQRFTMFNCHNIYLRHFFIQFFMCFFVFLKQTEMDIFSAQSLIGYIVQMFYSNELNERTLSSSLVWLSCRKIFAFVWNKCYKNYWLSFFNCLSFSIANRIARWEFRGTIEANCTIMCASACVGVCAYYLYL